MTAALLLLLAKATLVLGAGLVAARLLARAAAGVRHLVLVATLAGMLAVPALSAWAPLRLAVLPPAARDVAPPSATARAKAAPAPEAPLAGSPVATTSPGGAPAGGGERTPAVATPGAWLAALPVPLVLAATWALGALAVLAWLARGARAVRRLVRGATPLAGREWTDLLYDAADRLGLEDVPRLVRSDAVRMPFACGVRAPVIVLPAAADTWTPARRRAVLLHELAHVARRDMAWHLVARLACAAWWFHPLAWVAARRLRAESEQACDDLALGVGTPAADYAEHLLEIVVRVKHDTVPALAIAMARRSEFEGRMLAILDPDRPRVAPRRRQAGAIVAALVLPVLLVGAAAPVAATDGAVIAAPAAAPVAAPVAARGPAAASPTDGSRTIAAPGVVAAPDAGADPAAADTGRMAAAAPRADAGEAMPPDAPRATLREEVRAALRDAAAERDAALQGAAAEREAALAEVAHDPDVRIALLARLLRSDTSATVRRIAAWGLAEHAEERVALDALARAVAGDADATVREMAAWALAESDGDRVALASLARALRGDRDAAVRATAAWALGSIGEDDATAREALAAALRDGDARVRLRAIWALGTLEGEQAPPVLVASLRDADPRVREVTAWALGTIGDAAAARPLLQAMETERDPRLRRQYVRALAHLDEPPAQVFDELLASPDTALRRVAVRALAGRGAGGDPWPWPWPQPRPLVR